MNQKSDKTRKVSYYVGWGTAYGAFAGGMMSFVFKEYIACYLIGAAVGAAVGAVWGRNKLNQQS